MARPYGDMSVSALNPEQGVAVAVPEDSSIEVEIETPDGEEITIDPETGEIIMDVEDTDAGERTDHGANLAEFIDEAELDKIGQYIVECVAADEKSREPWYKRYREGLKNLGIYDLEDVAETIDAVSVKHPLLLEAATQFQARAMAELLPSEGPVKAGIYGDVTDDIYEQGRRVEMFMNYQLTVEDRGYYDERDQMLFRLPFSGSEFDKQYFCPVKRRTLSRWVKAEHFVVPHSACSLEDAPRYTQIIPDMTHNKYLKLVKAGFYRKADLGVPGEDTDAGERKQLQDAIDDMQGTEKSGAAHDTDNAHTFLECHIDYDLPGFEDEDGIALPYVITVDKESAKVVSIYRNWREEDEAREKRVWFTHKKMLPGFGFYGFGLIHTIGALGETATKLMEILLDSGAFATVQGGFKSKDAKLKGDVVLTPGKWLDTEMTAEELSRAFYTPPFKEPSQTLFSLLGVVVEGGQRFAATTETMVGDAATTGPVGSMVAQIEQGSKVFSGIHKRLHKAFGDEFIHIAELNGENLPDVYPYFVRGMGQNVLRSDFDGRVDIVPVSDPNIFSAAQRLAIANTGLQAAQQFPDLIDRREAVRGVLEAARHPNIDKILPAEDMPVSADPVTEAALILKGKPIKAEMWQDHASHNMVHGMVMQMLPPEMQPVMQAHMQEHEAMRIVMMMQQRMGIMLPPIDFQAKQATSMVQGLPPEMENQLAMMAGQAAQQMMAEQQAAAQAQEGQDQMAQQMSQMQQQLQGLVQENGQLKLALQSAEGSMDAQKEALKNQGKGMDIVKEQIKNQGKAVDLAKQQVQSVQKASK